MRPVVFLLLLISACLPACELTVKKGDKKERDDSKIRNGIIIKSKNLKVEQAFLLFEDGTRVPEDNVVQVNQKVILRLIVSGWTEKDGKVFLSGGETIETSEGEVILDEENLYKDYQDGIDPKDAQYISLSAVITKLDKLYEYFKVSFFIKDNSLPGSLAEGYYKLYIK